MYNRCWLDSAIDAALVVMVGWHRRCLDRLPDLGVAVIWHSAQLCNMAVDDPGLPLGWQLLAGAALIGLFCLIVGLMDRPRKEI